VSLNPHYDRSGSITTLSDEGDAAIHVRFTSESAQTAVVAACPLCAKTGLAHCSKYLLYSITSSACSLWVIRVGHDREDTAGYVRFALKADK
jgi:hypothetical protein